MLVDLGLRQQLTISHFDHVLKHLAANFIKDSRQSRSH